MKSIWEIRSLIRDLLIESREDTIEQLVKQFDINPLFIEELFVLTSHLPSIKWVLGQISDMATNEFSTPNIAARKFLPVVRDFFMLKRTNILPSNDIAMYTYETLENVVIRAKESKSKRSRRSFEKSMGSQKVFEDDDFIILKVNSLAACRLYGKGTQWCVSGDHEGGEDAWNDHKNDQIYFVISKFPQHNSLDKIAIVKTTKGEIAIYGAEDQYLSIDDLDKDRKNLYDYVVTDLSKAKN